MKPASGIFLLIEDIYKTIGEGGRWAAVLRSFQQLLGSAGCVLARFDFERRESVLEHAIGIGEPYRNAYDQRFAGQNPWLSREECFRHEGAIWTGRDLAEHRDLVSSEFYRDWLKPQDLFHASFSVLRWSDAETIYLMALRPPAAGAFERREQELLELYVPHLCQAIALVERLGGLGARETRGLEQLVHDAPGAVMVVDADDKVLAASHDAAALLARVQALPTGRSVLRLAHDRDRDRLARRLTATLRVSNGPPLEAGEPAPERAPAVRALDNASFVPLPPNMLPGQDRPAVAVIGEGRLPGEDQLRTLYGLTPAEARIAIQLARGQSVQEAATRLDIQITTARTHLQRVYSKTHTRRQSELVALLLGGGLPVVD